MTIHIQESGDTSLLAAATVLNSVALSPLLNATLSFLNVQKCVNQPGTSDLDMLSCGRRANTDPDQSFMRRASFFLKPLHLMIIVGLGLSVIGGIDQTKDAQTAVDNGAKSLRIATALFAISWVGLLIGCLVFVAHLSELTRSHRRVSI